MRIAVLPEIRVRVGGGGGIAVLLASAGSILIPGNRKSIFFHFLAIESLILYYRESILN